MNVMNTNLSKSGKGYQILHCYITMRQGNLSQLMSTPVFKASDGPAMHMILTKVIQGQPMQNSFAAAQVKGKIPGKIIVL